MVPTATLVVVMVGGADSVAIRPPKLVAAPVAMQLALLAQETPNREPTLDGAGSLPQKRPLLVVSRMVFWPTAVQSVEFRHDTADSAGVPAGVPSELQIAPPSVVPTVRAPTARQSAVVEHEIPSSAVTPAGTDCVVQVEPPFVVATMAAPGPTDDEPVAMQSRRLAQEIPVKFVTVAGMDSRAHELPPSVVPTTLGAPALASKSLTAKQTDSFAHETPVRAPTFEGTGWLDQVTPAFIVLMMTGLEKMPKPTAVQVDGETHEMPVRPLTLAGMDWLLQVRPTLVVCKTVSTPAAKQSAVFGQETELSGPIPGGGVCEDHDKPPVVVVMMVEPAPGLPLFPTATQSFALAQEILVTSTELDGTDWVAHVAPLFSVPIT
jgi:hypothetical protein